MPTQPLMDLGPIDLDQVAYDKEAVRAIVPQRHEMEMQGGLLRARAGQRGVHQATAAITSRKGADGRPSRITSCFSRLRLSDQHCP